MAVYSISDLEKLCGIKAHTIRVWEQRYGILQPKRTQTNIRYYLDEDLRHLLNIALLNKNGYKISKIAQMSRQEIIEKVDLISSNNLENETQLDALTIAMIEMNEQKFDDILSANIQKIGFENCMLEVIYPFLDKLSLLWLTDSIQPVQENFMSFLIRQKIIVAIDQLSYPKGANVPKFMLYLPEGESQELALLFTHYILKSRGCAVVYLGANIKLTDLEDAYHIHKADFMFSIISEAFNKQSIQSYVKELSASFPAAEILLSGYQILSNYIPAFDNVRIISDLMGTLQYLNQKMSSHG